MAIARNEFKDRGKKSDRRESTVPIHCEREFGTRTRVKSAYLFCSRRPSGDFGVGGARVTPGRFSAEHCRRDRAFPDETPLRRRRRRRRRRGGANFTATAHFRPCSFRRLFPFFFFLALVRTAATPSHGGSLRNNKNEQEEKKKNKKGLRVFSVAPFSLVPAWHGVKSTLATRRRAVCGKRFAGFRSSKHARLKLVFRTDCGRWRLRTVSVAFVFTS